MRIDQFVPSLTPHDAIGSHVLNARQALRRTGIRSEIWFESTGRPLRGEGRHYQEYPSSDGPADIVVYHASIHSRMASFLIDRPEPVVVDYHNITPSRFFAGWDPVMGASMDLGRVDLRRLAPCAELALADSPYNQAELVDFGYRLTAVCPILIDYDQRGIRPDPRALARLEQDRRRGGARWLFVGRLAPNKCQHDVIGAFAAYRRIFDSHARLTLVGATTSMSYEAALRRLAGELDVGDAVDFAGSIPLGHLLATYRTTDIFVCLSEHEGFCVPVIEAMVSQVPVVAFAAGALPDTAGDAAFLLHDKDPLLVACAVDRVLSDPPLRSELIAAGQARACQFSLERVAKEFVGHLSGLMGRLRVP